MPIAMPRHEAEPIERRNPDTGAPGRQRNNAIASYLVSNVVAGALCLKTASPIKGFGMSRRQGHWR
jgi:hypothetical protein